MQRAIECDHHGMILRGMEHVPEQDYNKVSPLPAVILFHGFTSTKLEPHRLFLKISRELESMGYASFRFDFLGSGESDGNFEDMTVSKEIAEAGAILDFVKQDPRVDSSQIILLGLSMGGLVASVLAGDRAQEIHKLILLAPAGNMYQLIKPTAEAYLAHPALKVIDHGGNLVGRAFAEDLRDIDVFGRAANYQGPVLLIHGTKDESVPYQVTDMYKEQSYGPLVDIHLIDGADHTFNKFEWEKELIDTICAFVGKKS